MRNINLHIGQEVQLIDHKAADHLAEFIQSSKFQNNLNIRMVGLENLEHAPLLSKVQDPLHTDEMEQLSAGG